MQLRYFGNNLSLRSNIVIVNNNNNIFIVKLRNARIRKTYPWRDQMLFTFEAYPWRDKMLFTFEAYLQGKTYGISWKHAEKQAKVLKKVFEKVSFFITN